MEQSLKNQAAVAAVCAPSTLEAFRLSQNVDPPENQDLAAQMELHSTMSPSRQSNSRLQSTPAPASIASSPLTSSAGHRTPQSYPASNEMMHVSSPMDHQHRNFSVGSNQFSPKSPIKQAQAMQQSYGYPNSSGVATKSGGESAATTQVESFQTLMRRNSKQTNSIGDVSCNRTLVDASIRDTWQRLKNR